MGGCVSSSNGDEKANGVSAEKVPFERDRRRRLTIARSTDASPDLAVARGRVAKGTLEGHVLTLFPSNALKMSVAGLQSKNTQRGFDNKLTDSQTDYCGTSWQNQGIGYACKKGLKPESPNQDDFFILKVDDWAMYGVFDGHGPNGHIVSHYVQTTLPRLIASDPTLWVDTKECLRVNFLAVHRMLEHSQICDCQLSGCTCTVIIHRGSKLYAAHVGDSRAVLAVRDPTRVSRHGRPVLKAIDLTQDHKPNLEAERKRIQSSGGQIRRLDGDIPYRVFVKNKQYPGLAMSRAIGDLIGTQAGVIAEPEVNEFDVDAPRSVFLVVCSDGVWEFISSQEAVNMISRRSRRHVQQAAEELAEESWKRWIAEEGNVVDDITVEIAYLFESDTHSAISKSPPTSDHRKASQSTVTTDTTAEGENERKLSLEYTIEES